MIVQGRLLDDRETPPVPGWLEIENGRILRKEDGTPPGRADIGDADTIVCPGFIDAHVHLPQVDVAGIDGLELLPWLNEVVFPAETAWADAAVATRQSCDTHRRMVEAGTLGYAGFLTSHAHSLDALNDAIEAIPLRVAAGQVLMDCNATPTLLGHEPVEVRRPESDRFRQTVNPRFAVSCSDALLRLAAGMAGDGTPIQTHLAESHAECRRVRELFPESPHYTAVYDERGLLTERTLLAHCLHLSAAEWELIAVRRSVVVHCPTANTFLNSGVFDLRVTREHAIRVALGSDVAGGPDLSMPRVARAMIDTAKTRRLILDPDAVVPSPHVAWNMITRGNADMLGWPDSGRLEVNAHADLLVLDPPFEIDEHLWSRLIHTWRDDYIRERIIAGRRYNPA